MNIYQCRDKVYNLEEGLMIIIKDKSFKVCFLDKKKFFKIDLLNVYNHYCIMGTKNKIVLEYLNTDSKHMKFI